MPQAADDQRALMNQWFGSIDCIGPIDFLLARGWTEKGGMWSKPTPAYDPSIYEVECVKFLRDEWDYDWHRPLYPEPLT